MNRKYIYIYIYICICISFTYISRTYLYISFLYHIYIYIYGGALCSLGGPSSAEGVETRGRADGPVGCPQGANGPTVTKGSTRGCHNWPLLVASRLGWVDGSDGRTDDKKEGRTHDDGQTTDGRRQTDGQTKRMSYNPRLSFVVCRRAVFFCT